MSEFDSIALINTEKILTAFQKHRVSDSHFAPSTGYGYNDPGRDVLDAVFAGVMGTEDAIVRASFASGTHAIACALKAVCPDGGYWSLTGEPYDTLRGIMPYFVIESGQIANRLAQTAPDRNAVSDRPSAFFIQRSRGYSDRKALSVADVNVLIAKVRAFSDAPIVVDNCYCEFVEAEEPSNADLIAGSLIKNPGGGLASAGGYIAGTRALVDKAAEWLTVPGMGREVGCSLGQNRLLFQGLFLAPHVVAQALKTAVFCAGAMRHLGFSVSPLPQEARYDIIQMISFGNREKLLSFTAGIQKGSPVDSFARPEPWAMPGYDDEVVMAAGTFIQGASIELSCDGPLREPFAAYMQGGLTYEAGRLGVLTAAAELLGL